VLIFGEIVQYLLLIPRNVFSDLNAGYTDPPVIHTAPLLAYVVPFVNYTDLVCIYPAPIAAYTDRAAIYTVPPVVYSDPTVSYTDFPALRYTDPIAVNIPIYPDPPLVCADPLLTYIVPLDICTDRRGGNTDPTVVYPDPTVARTSLIFIIYRPVSRHIPTFLTFIPPFFVFIRIYSYFFVIKDLTYMEGTRPLRGQP
jgi:hypothetical protein